MPCFEVRMLNLHMEKVDLELFKKALKSLGLDMNQYGSIIKIKNGRSVGSFSRGNLSVRGDSGVTPEQIKKAYSQEAVKQAGSRFGWRVQEKSPSKFLVSRQ